MFIPVAPSESNSSRDGQGIVRVDLDTAEVELFVETERPPAFTAIAGDRLIVPDVEGVQAYDVETGERLWRTEAPFGSNPFCQGPAVVEARVVLPCAGSQRPQSLDPIVWAVDAETGEVQWWQMLTPSREAKQGVSFPVVDPPRADDNSGAVSWSLGVSESGSNVFAVTIEASPVCYINCQETMVTRYTLWALEAGTGEVRWANRTDPATTTIGGGDVNEGSFPKVAGRATATPRVVYSNRAGMLEAFNPNQPDQTTGQPPRLWKASLGLQDATTDNFQGASSALSGDALYAASVQSLYRFDANGGEERWRAFVDLGETISPGSLIVAEGSLYAMSAATDGSYSKLYAFDTQTGERLWHHQIHPATEDDEGLFSYSIGEGVIAVAGEDATLTVIGHTNASLAPSVTVSTTIPGVGEPVTVDLSGTKAGVDGPATRFRADWGDGTATGWTNSSKLSHSYEDAGPHTARFWVANEANQTASATRTFDVGAEQPTFLETAFARENQDMTFGVLGIALALIGGVIGVSRRYRKKNRLGKELDTIEQAYNDAKDRPARCQAVLQEQKARVRGLLKQGKITDSQFAVLKERIEELSRQVRLSTLDERFPFLPHGMVVTLRGMLEDGHINDWEHQHFVDALEQEDTLTPEQRGRVRELIDGWFEQDSTP